MGPCCRSASAIDGTDAGGQEAEALDGRRGLPTEPRRLTRPLVEGGEGPVAARRVVGHPDRLRRTERGDHRDDRVMGVGGVEEHLPAGQEAIGFVDTWGPALRHDGGPQGTAQRIAGVAVRDRRAAVEEHALAQPRDHVTGRRHLHQLGRGLVEPAQHLGVGRVDGDRPPAVQPPEAGDQLNVAAGRDAPVHDGQRVPLRGDGVGEQGQPHVHDRGPLRQRGDDVGAPRVGHWCTSPSWGRSERPPARGAPVTGSPLRGEHPTVTWTSLRSVTPPLLDRAAGLAH